MAIRQMESGMAKPIRHRGKWRIRWIDADGKRRSEVYADYNDALRAERGPLPGGSCSHHDTPAQHDADELADLISSMSARAPDHDSAAVLGTLLDVCARAWIPSAAYVPDSSARARAKSTGTTRQAC
jgi:hypothetical protein